MTSLPTRAISAASAEGSDIMNALSYVSIVTAVFLPVAISILACAIAIAKTIRGMHDIPSRITGYTIVSSLGYGLVQVVHQIIALTSGDSESSTTVLASAAWFFLGYALFAQLYLTLVSYLRIRWQVKLELGSLDWHLHLPCSSAAGTLGLLFYAYDGFGTLGLLCLPSSSSNGYMVILTISVLALVNTLAALACKRSIAADLHEANEQLQAAESDFYQASTIFTFKSHDQSSPVNSIHKSHLTQEPGLDRQTARLRDKWIKQLNDVSTSTRLANLVTVSGFMFAPIFVSSLAVGVGQGMGMVDPAANVLAAAILNLLAAGNAVGYLYTCREVTRTADHVA